MKVPNKYNASKKERRRLYDYIEKLLGRKLKEFEQIDVSWYMRNAIHIQNEELSKQNRLIQQAIVKQKNDYKRKIKKIYKKNYEEIDQIEKLQCELFSQNS